MLGLTDGWLEGLADTDGFVDGWLEGMAVTLGASLGTTTETH